MAKPDLKLEDIVDRAACAGQMADIAARHGDGASNAARAELLAFLKDTLAEGRARAETMLAEDGAGLICAQR
ncbi:MAG: hypothetical protein AAFP99_09240, partial [Pseudomonadota bacterium]